MDERTEVKIGKQVDCNQADDRKVINLVKKRRLLYARTNLPVASYYAQVKKLWYEVASEMGWSGQYNNINILTYLLLSISYIICIRSIKAGIYLFIHI